MKLLSFASVCLLLACSSPRYLYRFSEPKGETPTSHPVAVKSDPIAPPLPSVSTVAPADYSADVAAPKGAPTRRIRESRESPVVKQPGKSMTMAQPAKESMDGDLKRAIIFTAAGVVALIIGGQVFYVAGSLSLLIGLIFGIKWFIRR